MSRRWLLVAFLLAGCENEKPEPAAAVTSAVPSASASGVIVVPAPASADPSWDPGRGAPIHVAVEVDKSGFSPEIAHFVKGRPAFLDFTRTEASSCLESIKMPWSDETIDLPLNRTVRVQIPDTSQDGEFRYGCWMDMVFGRVVIAAPDAGG